MREGGGSKGRGGRGRGTQGASSPQGPTSPHPWGLEETHVPPPPMSHPHPRGPGPLGQQEGMEPQNGGPGHGEQRLGVPRGMGHLHLTRGWGAGGGGKIWDGGTGVGGG